MSDPAQSFLTADSFAPKEREQARTYNVDPLAPRGVVDAAAKVSVVIGKHAKNERLYVVRENAEGAQTGMPLEVIGALIRDGIIPPEVVRDLQIEGGVYSEELHAPEVETEAAQAE